RGRVRRTRPRRRPRRPRRAAGDGSRLRQPGHRLREGRGGTGTRARLRRAGRGDRVTAPAATTTWSTLRRGLSMSPELRTGLAGTLLLAVLATAGRVVVPVAIQQGMDHGLRAPGGPDLTVITRIVAITVGVLALTMTFTYLMNVRLYTVSETALAG